jgi:hypothetical protein
MELEARKAGNLVIMTKRMFKYMILCQEKQKEIHKLSPEFCKDLQKKIDDYFEQCKKLLDDNS